MSDGERSGSGSGRRLFAVIWRYLAATVLGVAANLTLYLSFVRLFGIYPPVANLMAAFLVIGPRFFLNKIWVWRHRETKRIGFEAAVHTALTVAGLALSTVVAWVLARADAGVVVLAVGNVSAFAVTWVLRFFVSHFYLFTHPDEEETEPSEALRPG